MNDLPRYVRRRNDPRSLKAAARWGCFGFSLVELVCVVAILVILTAIAAPRFGGSIARQRVEAAARRITADLALAQRHAKLTNASQTVRFRTTSPGYQLLGMTHPDRPGSAYDVDLRGEPYAVTAMKADCGGDVDLVYDMYGVPDSGAWVVVMVGDALAKVVVDAEGGKPDNMGTCLPKNVDCSADAECCTNYCEPSSKKCKDAP